MHRLAQPRVFLLPVIVAAALLLVRALPAHASTLTVATTALPQGEVAVAYSSTVIATGGTPPYAYSLVAGSLPVGLALNGSTGALTGTPTTAGPSAFIVQVTDAAANTATQVFTPTISAPGTLAVTTPTLPGGQVSLPYASSLVANGGTVPYTWSVTAGALPAGLTLNSATGLLSGTPTAAGTTSFTVQVADSAAHTATQALAVVVSTTGTLTVTTTSLPVGQVGVAYAQTLAATGGTAPYVWSTTLGALPAGLTLNASTGVISGTPTTTGTTSFSVQVADSAAHTATQALSIMVNLASTLTVTPTTLPAGQLGIAYAQTLSATGGVLPYTWTVSAGSLPAGLSLNPTTGVLSGTPTVAGTTSFTVEVADSATHTAMQTLSMTVNASGTLVVTTTALPTGQVGVGYAQTLAATGGVTPYSWSLAAGSLPAGLTLNAATGLLSGTPTGAGTTSFTAQVTDSASHAATQALSIAVTATGTLSVVTTSLPTGQVGVGYAQALTASGGTLPYTWAVTAGALPAGLTLNSSSGVISGTPTALGSSFTVQVTDSASAFSTQTLSIAVNPSGTLVVTTTALADGQVGVAYPQQTLTASGGTAPYLWSLVSGALPSGLILDSTTGTISGTPTTVETATFTLRVTDSLAATATQALSINVLSSTAGTGTMNAQVLAVCQSNASTNPQLPALCQIYTSGQLPAQLEQIIGSVILRLGEQTPVAEDFTTEVNAACQTGASANPEIPALCQIFNSGQLPPKARNDIGRLILRLTGTQLTTLKTGSDRDDRNQQSQDAQGDHQNVITLQPDQHGRPDFSGIPAWARPNIVVPSATVVTWPQNNLQNHANTQNHSNNQHQQDKGRKGQN